MVVVIDASVAVKGYVTEAWRTEALSVLASAAELIAPDIILTDDWPMGETDKQGS